MQTTKRIIKRHHYGVNSVSFRKIHMELFARSHCPEGYFVTKADQLVMRCLGINILCI